MDVDASTLPRFGPPLAAPRPRVLSEWLSTRDRRRWPQPPDGGGRPVMLIPGFLAGDQSLTRMALWMRDGGWRLARSGISWNVDHSQRVVSAVHQRLERAVQAAGAPALLIGQSRGGSIARAAAALRPDLVQTVVTLGSPLVDQLAIQVRTWPSVLGVGILGTVGVPGMFSLSCLNGECCAEVNDAVTAPLPPEVQLICVYSRSDEVVKWRACIDPQGRPVEVDTSHIGMGMAREVWEAVARELAPRPALPAAA